jgi:hypothetical protein
MFNHLDLTPMDAGDLRYIQTKREVYKKLFLHYNIENEIFLRELMANHYSDILNNLSNKEIIDEIHRNHDM